MQHIKSKYSYTCWFSGWIYLPHLIKMTYHYAARIWVNVTSENMVWIVLHLLTMCSFFSLFFLLQRQRKPSGVSGPLRVPPPVSLRILLCFYIYSIDLPCIVTCPPSEPSALLSTLVILSVVAIMGVSAVIWFLHQKHNLGSTILTAFEYHPPFRVLDADQSCLVEAEETDSAP